MDIRRHALNERLDEERTEALLSHLERGGWVWKRTKPSGPAGGKPVVRWEVNPILFSNQAQKPQKPQKPDESRGYSG